MAKNFTDTLWSAAECAEYFSISVATWWRWVAHQGAPQPALRRPKVTRWSAEAVKAWAAQNG